MRMGSEADKSTGARGGRVVFATAAVGHDRVLIETAVTLASSRGAELMALFVQDVNLLNLSDLPFAMEVVGSSAVTRSLNASLVGRSLRTQTRRLNDMLKQLASARRLITSMRVVRGHLLREALAATERSDLLILGARRRPVQHGAAQPRRRERKPVAVVQAAGAHQSAALQLAAEVARAAGRELLVCVVGSDDAGAADEASLRALRESGESHRVRIQYEASLEEAVAAARAARARFLIMNREQAQDAGAALAAFLERPDGAVVLVP